MLSILASMFLAAGPAPQATPAAPNVLFIVIDDASWEEFTGLTLPAIQGAAQLGRVYDHFYTSPVCSPSRAQLHFGRYPHDHLIGTALPIQKGEGVPLSDVSLAEALKVEGYSTGMFGKWHVNGSALPMYAGEAARLHGYDTWRAGSINNVMNTGGSHDNWERWDDGQMYVEGIYTTHAIGDELIGWWARAGLQTDVVRESHPRAANRVGGPGVDSGLVQTQRLYRPPPRLRLRSPCTDEDGLVSQRVFINRLLGAQVQTELTSMGSRR